MAKTTDQGIVRSAPESISNRQFLEPIEPFIQLGLIHGNLHTTEILESPCVGDLVVIGGLPQCSMAGENQHRLLVLHGRDDGPGPGMGDHQFT